MVSTLSARRSLALLKGERKVDPFTGWEKHGSGGRYYLTSPDGRIALYYDIAGSAIGIARNWARSARPWTVQIEKRAVKNSRGVIRTFGSKEAALAVAEKETAQALINRWEKKK